MGEHGPKIPLVAGGRSVEFFVDQVHGLEPVGDSLFKEPDVFCEVRSWSCYALAFGISHGATGSTSPVSIMDFRFASTAGHP